MANSAVLMPWNSGGDDRQRDGPAARRDSAGAPPRSATSSAKKPAMSPVTAGIRKIEPATMPSAAATDSTQDNTQSGVVVVRPKVVSNQRLAALGEPDQHAVQPDRGDDNQQQRDAYRFQQDPAERRGEHLGERFDGGIEHGGASRIAFTPRGRRRCRAGLREQSRIGQCPAQPCGTPTTMSKLTRRSFLAAAGAIAASPALGATQQKSKARRARRAWTS